MAHTPIFPPTRVTILGVLNSTPDSFSDGGRFLDDGGRVRVRAAVEAGRALAGEGAHVLDVGGESTRPGAREVPVREEIARTRPLVAALCGEVEIPISIDTRKAEVAAACLDAGATQVNDVSGGRFDPALLKLVAERDVPLVLGHLRGDPSTMQRDPRFEDVVGEVAAELAASVARAEAAGVRRERLAVDPGIGFGKRPRHNLELIARVGELRRALRLPVLVGPSRKAFLGELTGDPVGAREIATAAACAVAVFAGADAVRVHDAGVARRVVAVAQALRAARGDPA